MNTVKIKSYAKINLTLEIKGIENGYHLLDSLVASIDLFDLVVLKKRKDNLSSITMHGMGSEGIPPEENIALKTAELFSETFSTPGVDVTVYKNIPIGAGLGGSSADSAGVINGMAKLYGITDEDALTALAEKTGSDTSYMRKGGFQRMQGRGEKLTPLSIQEKLYFLLLCPKTSVSSKACFQTYDNLPRTLEYRGEPTRDLIEILQQNRINEGGMYLMNDLYVPATHLNKEVEIAKKEAESFSPLGVTMTGSGSAVLAWFESKELCEWAKSRYRGKCNAYVVATVVPNEGKSIFRNPFALEE